MGVAYAASNAAGSIFGNAESGTVVIENTETGLTREVPVEDGRFNASNLPIGNYNVTLMQDGEAVSTREGVFVRIGSGSEVHFAAADGDATELAAITVTGAAITPIDVSSTDTRVVFTSELLQKIPVGRSIHEVALLTPGVVAADSRYGNTASFGGSAASENAFYINGYAVTNPLTNLGHTDLPFNGIAQFQAITGGYGAEFGRATGGVVNIVTKSGTNDFKAGAMLYYEPESLRGTEKNIYNPDNGTPVDGLLYDNREVREVDTMTYGAYVSGPVIHDKLFYFVSTEMQNQDVIDTDPSPGGAVDYTDAEFETPRWLVKLDWNITNNHLFDFTAISDTTKETDRYYPYYFSEGNGIPAFTKGNTQTGGYYYEDGGETYIAKYTGYLTNNLTLSALYGTQEVEHIAIPAGYDPTVKYVSDSRTDVSLSEQVAAGQYQSLPFPDAYDETEGYRLDIEYRLGDHNLRLGYDRQDSESKTGEIISGPTEIQTPFGGTGSAWHYESYPANVQIEGARPGTIAPPPASTDCETPDEDTGLCPAHVVVDYIYANGGTFSVEQAAFYLEDQWQLNQNWLLRLGIRNETFTNFNADGAVYAEQDSQWAPRLGFTWDVFGDSTFKVFGQVGRYHLAMPMNVAARAASASFYTEEYFSFTGIDPETGIPQGLTPLSTGPYSSNNEYGTAPDPATVAASSLESHYQDELVLGFEKLLAGTWNFGARWVYRDLKSAIDDMCDGRPGERYALAHGYSQADADAFASQLQGCRMFNPGADNTFRLLDANGDIQTLAISADEMGFPELKRTYNAVDLFIEYPFDGQFYYKVDYTWSQNYGNAEGQLKSDIGQQDVSITQDWDHPELMEHANGYLPNDRRHFLKAFGYWQFTDELRFSGTFIAHSGRPKNCFGYYSNPNRDPDFVPYGGPYYMYCDGEVSQRASHGRLPTTTRLDLGVSYAPNMFDNKLALGLDVFNVLDTQEVQSITEYGELGGPGVPYSGTNRVLDYSDPRVVRFSVRYDF